MGGDGTSTLALAAATVDGGLLGLAGRLTVQGRVVLVVAGPPPSRMPDGVAFVGADLRTAAGAERAIDEVESGWGPVTRLVTAPSPATAVPVQAVDDALWASTLEANLSVAMHAARAAARRMSGRGSGRIAVITWRLERASGLAHLAAASGALAQFARALAPELGPAGITVNVVAVAPDDLGSAADGVALALSSDAGYLTGEVLAPMVREAPP